MKSNTAKIPRRIFLKQSSFLGVMALLSPGGYSAPRGTKVVAATVNEGVCDENGRLNVDKVSFFGMTAGSGEFYTMEKKVGHIGQNKGRKDIKY